ncbi:YihY/virulence factor BrkB family protein [Fodinibius salsisoli]|uniref:YihY/virulence factor BrkB family protein n=1 Tax=Fodinibius salsisoli TaxID=2820877 RepID=A0ABT3PPR0_9BACT|nr:YihY/virulence factor BrkB family protein [Fodinibius salsisoli]
MNSDQTLFQQVKALLIGTYQRIGSIDLGVHSAAIAFYSIFSTAPLIILLVWLLGVVLGGEMGQNELQKMLDAVVGPELSEAIQSMVEGAGRNSTGLWSSIIAMVTLVFGATTLLTQLKKSLNVVWNVREAELSTVRAFLWDRLRALLFIGSISLLFFLSLLSESIIYVMEQALLPLFGSEELFLIQLGSSAVNIMLALIFFMMMFKILPDLEVRFRDLAVGALVTALLFLLGKSLVGWYLTTSSLQPTYKTAGSFVIFLIWIYYNAQIILIGAAFSREYARLYGSKVQPRWEGTLDQDG